MNTLSGRTDSETTRKKRKRVHFFSQRKMNSFSGKKREWEIYLDAFLSRIPAHFYIEEPPPEKLKQEEKIVGTGARPMLK